MNKFKVNYNVGHSNSAGSWNAELRGGFTQWGSCASRTYRRINGCFYPLMRAMRSMRGTTQPCCRRCAMSVPVMRILNLTATATEPPWWSGKAMEQVTSFTVRRGWFRGIPWTWSHMACRSSPLFGTSGCPTPALLNLCMLMILERGALYLASTSSWNTWCREISCGDICQSRPRASWSCLHEMSRR